MSAAAEPRDQRVEELEEALAALIMVLDDEAAGKFAPGFGPRLGHAVNDASRALRGDA